MAKMTVRSTFALDPATVATLDNLATRWGVSKSEAIRRIVTAAAVIERADEAEDAIEALNELQQRLGLSEEQVEAWVEEARALRTGVGP